MSPETERSIPIAISYVKRWLLLAGLLGAIVPVGLVLFMMRFGFDLAFGLALGTTVAVLLFALGSAYRKGSRQVIHLHRNKLVFDFMPYTQEFAFDSARHWTIEEQGRNWKITALTDQSSKLVPKAAFPHLKSVVAEFYTR